MYLHEETGLTFFSITQVYGDLHGHNEHLHETGDDSVWWWRRQKEVNSSILTLASILPSTELNKIICYYEQHTPGANS